MTMVSDATIDPIRDASRRMVRELGFMRPTLAETDMSPSAVHSLIEIGRSGTLQASDLCDLLGLEKSSVSRLVGKLVRTGMLRETADEKDRRAKVLSLTDQGRQTLSRIDDYARRQVHAALSHLPENAHVTVREGLLAYAGALAAARENAPTPAAEDVAIIAGYQPGLIGRVVEMHGRFYARTEGFGAFFEARVAAGLAEFSGRLAAPCNQIWAAMEGGRIAGSIAIDGEDLGENTAHLRWFIMDDALRGKGAGRQLLQKALQFCDDRGFAQTRLWTFRGLDAARRLYEAHGFMLEDEWPGAQWGSEVMEQKFIRKRPV
ncbi:bifunctional helix-turn-helix transcriptional regulator/GNAT family N-acetyltransferase [Thalassospira marina]|nr:bifunctional helix-turn-helix transcriptional regulator/GNAT family N-acetyltransferase [Thalassospira marina]